MKVLFVRVTSTHEFFCGFDGDLLALGLDEGAEGILTLAKESAKLSKKLKTEVTLSTFTFPTIVGISAIEEQVKSKVKREKIVDIVEGMSGYDKDYLVVDIPVKQMLAIEQESESVECAQIEVDTRNVIWTFYPKHTDMLYSTVGVPLKIFDKAK